MSPTSLLIILLGLSAFAYYIGRRKAFSVAGATGGAKTLHSRPTYCGALTALWCGIPALDPIATARIEDLIDELGEQYTNRNRHPLHAASVAGMTANGLLSPRRFDRSRGNYADLYQSSAPVN